MVHDEVGFQSLGISELRSGLGRSRDLVRNLLRAA